MSTGPEFNHFNWHMTPPDPNDRLIGQVISESMSGVASDVVLFGVPFDGAVIGRRGAADGPRAIRTQLQKMKAYSFARGELSSRIHDLGDVILLSDDVQRAHKTAEQTARIAFARRKENSKRGVRRVIALGGDHSLTYPFARPYLEKFQNKLAVINLDAHLDVRKPPRGQPFNSGTSFGRLLDEGLSSYTVIGVRDFQTSSAYAKRVSDSGGRVVTAEEMMRRGIKKTARIALGKLPRKCEAIYLSVDIDVADASVAPGVSAPTPGGLLAHQLIELVRELAGDSRVIASDIVETAPSLEEPGSDRTIRLAAACLAEMLYN